MSEVIQSNARVIHRREIRWRPMNVHRPLATSICRPSQRDRTAEILSERLQ